MYKTEVKIDKSTLPRDGQKVRFETYEQYDIIGTYDAEQDLFIVNSKKYYQSWDVHSWEPV